MVLFLKPRVQTHFVIPEVMRYWEQMKDEIWDILSKESVVLCGDGRNDSPGHCAKYCMYALMEQHLDVIVDVEVVDKRQTKGISTNMEVFGFKTILERMVGKLLISEVVTDASAAIMKMVREMKGNKCIKFLMNVTCIANAVFHYYMLLYISCGISVSNANGHLVWPYIFFLIAIKDDNKNNCGGPTVGILTKLKL